MTDLTDIANQAAAPPAETDYEVDARKCEEKLVHDSSLSQEERTKLILKLKDDAAHDAKGAIAHATMTLIKAKNLSPEQRTILISILESNIEAHPRTTFFSVRDLLDYSRMMSKRNGPCLSPEETENLVKIRDAAFAKCPTWEGLTPALSLV